MSLKCMPLLFLNMGSEMVYILQQRLKVCFFHFIWIMETSQYGIGSKKKFGNRRKSNKLLWNFWFPIKRKFQIEGVKSLKIKIRIRKYHFQAQNVSKEKTIQVLRDILHILFNTKFLKELFKPQYVCSRQIMRIFFEKLVQSSIMRLNEKR